MTTVRSEEMYWMEFKDSIITENDKESWPPDTPERVVKSWLSWLKKNHLEDYADPKYLRKK